MATTTVHEDPPTADEHPRTSTPRREGSSHPDPLEPEFEASAEFKGLPLQPYDGPVDDDAIDQSLPVVKTTVTVPTLRPLSKIGTNSAILARRSEAITKGATAIGKGFLLRAQRASRRIYSSVFPRELDLLETLLTEVEKLELLDGSFAYRVDQATYQYLLQILYKLRSLAEDSFRIAGKTPQTIPSWGDDEDILEAYDQNSFEILGVCFRLEVEHFL
ncbi:hypothetical protein B0H11DRAFT_1911780 [Mycena galericulata]|nr:hypothetical protein B0H11DRAFT_1911780 [Mycena galericulata]